MLFCSDLSEKKRAFLTGTLLLTAAGFLCRLLGFFYRIFLSRTIGAEGLGIYNMVHPVYGICFALCGGSIQTALSQYIAAHESQGRKVFRTGLTISMVLSGILAFLVCQYPAWIASRILMGKIQIITGLVKDHRNLFFDLLFISCILLSKNP